MHVRRCVRGSGYDDFVLFLARLHIPCAYTCLVRARTHLRRLPLLLRLLLRDLPGIRLMLGIQELLIHDAHLFKGNGAITRPEGVLVLPGFKA